VDNQAIAVIAAEFACLGVRKLDIVANAPEQQKSPQACAMRALLLVAGAGFEPATFRL
jgi:hypothetical protein